MRNNKGFSLVEVLITGAIMGIISMAMFSMISAQRQELKAMNEKMLTMDLQSLTQKVVGNSDYCSCVFKGMTFNGSTKSWNSFPTSLANGYGPSCAASANSILKVGDPIMSSQVKVLSFSMTNVSELIAGSGTYSGQLQIKFDPTSLVRPVKDVEVSMTFSVDTTDPVNNRKVASCSSAETFTVGPWVTQPTTSGLIRQAPETGIVIATSAYNAGIRFSSGPTPTSLVTRAMLSARDKYGMGYEVLQMPVKKFEYWKVESTSVSQGTTWNPLTSVYFRAWH